MKKIASSFCHKFTLDEGSAKASIRQWRGPQGSEDYAGLNKNGCGREVSGLALEQERLSRNARVHRVRGPRSFAAYWISTVTGTSIVRGARHSLLLQAW